MLRPDTLALTALLGLLNALGPLSMDMYLPTLPEIGRQLAARPAQVQLTISGYLVGFAFGQVIYGPIVDRFGRKPPLLAALAIFSGASLLCAVAHNIDTLIAARALQALGTSGALVLARVIVRDLYEGSRAGRELSVMAMMAGSMPIVAPLIGGVLQHTFGWRSAFAVILAGGVLATTMVWRFLPETTRRTDFEPLSVGELVGNYWIVGRNRIFLAHAGIAMASYAGLFAYISGASFVIQDLYGLTPLAFSVFLSVTASGYMIGSFVAARTVERAGLDRTIGAGALALAGGGAAMLVSVALFPQAPAAIALPMMLYVAGLGLAAPAAFAGAMQPFPGRAGAASSLVGCIQQTASAVAGAIVGHLIGNSAWPFVISIAAMGCLSLALWWLTRTIRTARLAHGEPSAPRK